MRRFARFLGVALTSAVALGLLASPVSAASTTRYVDDDGHAGRSGCDGSRSAPTSIQAAVNASMAGDVVVVCKGTYVGAVTVTKPITVRGVSNTKTIVKAGDNNDLQGPVIFVQNTVGAKIRSLHIVVATTGACNQVGGAITVSNSRRTTVTENRIETDGGEDSCGYESGVRLTNGSNGSTISYNIVNDFKVIGIDVMDSSNLTIRYNKIAYNHLNAASAATDFGAAGIQLNGSATGITIAKNTVSSAPTGGTSTPLLGTGIGTSGIKAVIRNNTVTNVAQGIVVLNTDGTAVTTNTVSASYIAIELFYSDSGTVSGNQATAPTQSMTVNYDSHDNTISDNNFGGPAVFDCSDSSTGDGTSGTDNTWTNNVGYSTPEGLCTGEEV